MSFVLMAFGPYRFSMATFAYEELQRTTSSRIESQKVIGARPPLHKMGPDDETMQIDATFFPFHLTGNQGLAQLATIRKDVGSSYPLIGNLGSVGDVFGTWALLRVRDKQSHIAPNGVGQQIKVDIDLIFDGRPRAAGALAAIGLLFG